MEAGTDIFGTIVVFAEVHINLHFSLTVFFNLYVFIFWIYYVLASAILCSNK